MRERIAKLLARCGVASRRRSEELLRRGLVEVNHEKVLHPSFLVDGSCDHVAVNGKTIQTESPRYIILNKPRDVLSTVSDMRGRKTVLDFVTKIKDRLYPVGRLDKDTTGLILLTNDGELTNRLTHPRYEVPRVYEVEVKGFPKADILELIRGGVVLEEGKTAPCKCSVRVKKKGSTLLEMILREGKKRQIRRIFSLLKHRVINLRRIAFGPLELGDLKEGKCRELSDGEVLNLKKAVGIKT